jgi:hypothetical protein
MPTPSALADLLNESSTPYRDPLVRLNWDGLDLGCWWLPPQAMSLYGVAEFERLPAPLRRRVSQHEFVWRLEVGLWLESVFIERLAVAADVAGDPALRCRFLHEIREQAGHSLMFLELFGRSGIRIPRAAHFRPPLAHWMSRHLPTGGALFWATVVIGEEFPDKLSRMVRQGTDEAAVSALAQQMATMHTIAEARHIAHARAMCGESSRSLPAWRRRTLSPLLDRGMRQYAGYVFYPPAELYRLAGLPPGPDWHALAAHNPRRRQLVARAIKPTVDFLREQGWRIGPFPPPDRRR